MLTIYRQCPGHCGIEKSHGTAVNAARPYIMERVNAGKVRSGGKGCTGRLGYLGMVFFKMDACTPILLSTPALYLTPC